MKYPKRTLTKLEKGNIYKFYMQYKDKDKSSNLIPYLALKFKTSESHIRQILGIEEYERGF